MPADEGVLDRMVTALLPSLSRGLAEQFNVFRVMRHGTHEKQLSNVFAWLLTADGTHGLGDAFQRLFIDQVNSRLPDASPLPAAGYRVIQEVDTSGSQDTGKDIADILLTSEKFSVVVENFESSDGHGHDYQRYLAHGAAGGRHSVVVLLCARREPHRQTGGWERAAVVTYADLLEALKTHIAGDPAWRRRHPRQDSFIGELVQHFTEGPGTVGVGDRITFIKTMCETGQSARYGHRPQEAAAREFADLLALHAKRQFEDGRRTLAEAKRALKRYADRTLAGQLNASLPDGRPMAVSTRFVGQWEWCVELQRGDSGPDIYLEFGPTAAVQNQRAAEPVEHPDFSRIFIARQTAEGGDGIDRIAQTQVGLDEVLAGLDPDDVRLHDAVLAAIRAI